MSGQRLRRLRFCLIAAGAWAVMATLGFFAPIAAEEVPLAWKFSDGQRLDVHLTQRTEADTVYTGKTLKLAVDLELDLVWEISRVMQDSGSAMIEQRVQRIQARISDGQGGGRQYDSMSKRNPADLRAAFDPYHSSVVRFEMERSGKLRSIEAPSTPRETKETPGSPQLDMPEMLRQAALVFPATPLSKGSEWMSEYEVPSPAGKLAVQTTYQYAGEVDEEGQSFDKISLVGKLQIGNAARTNAGSNGGGEGDAKSDNATKENEKDQKKLDIQDHSQTGTVMFDRRQGRIASSQLKQLLKTKTRLRETVIETTTRSTLELSVKPAAP